MLVVRTPAEMHGMTLTRQPVARRSTVPGTVANGDGTVIARWVGGGSEERTPAISAARCRRASTPFRSRSSSTLSDDPQLLPARFRQAGARPLRPLPATRTVRLAPGTAPRVRTSTARRGRPAGLPIAVRRGPLSRAWGRSGRSPEPRNEPRHRAGPRAARWSAPRFLGRLRRTSLPVSVVRAPPVASRAAPQPMICAVVGANTLRSSGRWCSVTRRGPRRSGVPA